MAELTKENETLFGMLHNWEGHKQGVAKEIKELHKQIQIKKIQNEKAKSRFDSLDTEVQAQRKKTLFSTAYLEYLDEHLLHIEMMRADTEDYLADYEPVRLPTTVAQAQHKEAETSTRVKTLHVSAQTDYSDKPGDQAPSLSRRESRDHESESDSATVTSAAPI